MVTYRNFFTPAIIVLSHRRGDSYTAAGFASTRERSTTRHLKEEMESLYVVFGTKKQHCVSDLIRVHNLYIMIHGHPLSSIEVDR